MTIKVNLNMNVSVVNPNRYQLKVDLLDIGAYLVVNKSALTSERVNPETLSLESWVGLAPTGASADYTSSYTRRIASANATNLVLDSYKTTLVGMVFAFKYTPDPAIGLIDDPVFAEFLNVCGVLGTARPALVDFAAVVSISNFKLYTLSTSGSFLVNCPITSDEISSYENVVSSGQAAYKALNAIFDPVYDRSGPHKSCSLGLLEPDLSIFGDLVWMLDDFLLACCLETLVRRAGLDVPSGAACNGSSSRDPALRKTG
ncbi:hypothetical protein HK405_012049, partial [Cladochytrium tenue]